MSKKFQILGLEFWFREEGVSGVRGVKTASAFAPKTIPPLDTVQNRLGMSTKTPRPAEKKKRFC